MEILDKEEALKRIQSAQDGRSSESQPFYNPSPPRSKPRVEIKPKEINGSSESINARVNGSSGVKTRTPSSNMEAKETAAARKESIIEDGPLRDDNSESGGLFAVYRSEGSFQKVPLDVMEKLGYSEAEVETIQPDALDMIVLEDIPKPKSGIPPRWKLANINEAGDERVLIMDSVEAKQYRPARRKAKRREAEAGRDRASESRKRPQRDSPDLDSDGKSESRRTRRERQSLSRNGNRKPIYSGRQSSLSQTSKLQKRPDPPQPEVFWPDIDTFRTLLRQEAGFRLNVLGDDWADIVKQESDWRLNLYRDWLWTLHDGIGNPIVESRSERARRLGRQGSPRQLEPRSKKKSSATRRRRPPSD